MRITDISLSPFIIEVTDTGFMLLKRGVRQEGKDKGAITETVEGYYGKRGLPTIINSIVHANLVSTGKKVTLKQFLEEYRSEYKAISDKLDSILNPK